jgi:3-phosphoshikimate 1-carboxyvinyltransferase
MKILIEKSEIDGSAQTPPSKSYTIRGLMCAALAKGRSELLRPLSSDDTDAAFNVLSKIGVGISAEEGLWQIDGNDFRTPLEDLYCGDSATTFRFMTAIGSLVPGGCRLTAGPTLSKRPIKILVEALNQWGVDVSGKGDTAPVTIRGGQLKGGLTELPGNISSQYVSALLLVAPFAAEKARVKLSKPLESKSYVLMTLECLQSFGIHIDYSDNLDEFQIPKQSYKPARYVVEGDWSSASYLLGLGAVAGEITVGNLSGQSLQGDKAIVSMLRDMNASVKFNAGSINVQKKMLNAIKADLNNCIDLLPTVAVLAALAQGTSEFSGIQRARLKESDRIAAVREGLERVGIKVVEEPDKIMITGGKIRGAAIDTKNDHRIAMAFSLLGIAAGGITIEGAECISKTYPDYWNTLRSIGGKIIEQ